jgi:hypothetical protein
MGQAKICGMVKPVIHSVHVFLKDIKLGMKLNGCIPPKKIVGLCLLI